MKLQSVGREPRERERERVFFASHRPGSRVGSQNQTRGPARGELGSLLLAQIKHTPITSQKPCVVGEGCSLAPLPRQGGTKLEWPTPHKVGALTSHPPYDAVIAESPMVLPTQVNVVSS
jgi:hypothetical protein